MRKNLAAEFEEGILQQISDTTEDAIVYFPKKDESLHVYMMWSERPLYIKECVDLCTAFRIEVVVEKSHISKYIISVNPSIFVSQIKRNNVVGEHYLIQMIKSIHKQIQTHDETFSAFDNSKSNENCTQTEFWNQDMIIFPHQISSLDYMIERETQIRNHPFIEYSTNIMIPNTGWYIDLAYELFTETCFTNTCRIRGAYLCDETGSGKTIVSLNLISRMLITHNKSRNYCSKATLLIVPINLPMQWYEEIERVLKNVVVIKLFKTNDLKGLDMEQLQNANIVLTTINFIQQNKTYNDILNGFTNMKGNMKKSRALFHSLSRNKNITLPLLQLVHWNRIVVDEIHEIKERDLKILKNFSTEMFWGLTATPNFNTCDELNHMNFMIEDIVIHPNIYKAFIDTCMKGNTNVMINMPNNSLRLIQVTDEEKCKINNKTQEETIILTSSYDDTISFFTKHSDLNNMVIQPQKTKILKSQFLLNVQQKSLIVSTLLIAAVWCAEEFSTNKIHYKIILKKMSEILFNEQKQKINSVSNLLGIIEKTKKRKIFMEDSLNSLEKKREICPICFETICSAVTKCGHIFCMQCISQHYNSKTSCPICKDESSISDVFRIINENENSKLIAIKHMIDSVDDPVIVFSQFKKVLKHIKIILMKDQDYNDKVFVLEGNVSQRSSILNEFKYKGGILLLCTTDSFAGIRLPNVKYVIFSHALFGDYSKVKSIEMQAIGRAVQSNTNDVSVMSFVSAETQEESVWRMNHP